jgi:hypothetical protein
MTVSPNLSADRLPSEETVADRPLVGQKLIRFLTMQKRMPPDRGGFKADVMPGWRYRGGMTTIGAPSGIFLDAGLIIDGHGRDSTRRQEHPPVTRGCVLVQKAEEISKAVTRDAKTLAN